MSGDSKERRAELAEWMRNHMKICYSAVIDPSTTEITGQIARANMEEIAKLLSQEQPQALRRIDPQREGHAVWLEDMADRLDATKEPVNPCPKALRRCANMVRAKQAENDDER